MHTLRGMHIVAPVETVMRGHRIVEPKRIRRIYASSTGSGIMGSESLSGRCYIGRCLLGRCLRILQSSSRVRGCVQGGSLEEEINPARGCRFMGEGGG